MMTTSRTDAHKVFANLYRKKRSPEHQKKVDEIITRSNDVFIRIDLIKKLDEEYFEGERKKGDDADPPEETSIKRSLNEEIIQDKFDESEERNLALKKDPGDSDKKTPEQKSGGGIGFLEMLFGGASVINRFAKESKALDIGLFGRKVTISRNVEKLF
ncbi:MAG: hypothetical protein KDK45_13355, partial [Leptospiraceae bacterium]|nr:hypothetical protein [Leptospiraceae bacterium]